MIDKQITLQQENTTSQKLFAFYTDSLQHKSDSDKLWNYPLPAPLTLGTGEKLSYIQTILNQEG